MRKFDVSVVSLELPSDYIFQNYNDPKNTAKSTKLLSENDVNILQWPNQSPDLNPIWNFWKFKSEKEYQQTSIIWRQYTWENGTKYLLSIARNRLVTVEVNYGVSKKY